MSHSVIKKDELFHIVTGQDTIIIELRTCIYGHYILRDGNGYSLLEINGYSSSISLRQSNDVML